ncbi:MAG: 6-carboxytetrahydropterin synthase, partial [Opitutales bacterium]
MPKPKTARRRPVPPLPAGPVYVTRQVHFNSAHRLYNPAKSLAWNKQQYGLCTNPYWHGHN